MMWSSDKVLLASSPGGQGEPGGLFRVSNTGVLRIDPLPTSGLARSPDGMKLARVSTSEREADPTSLRIYDRRGLVLQRRLDDVGEAHSLLWADNSIYVTSTRSNRVVQLSTHGDALDLLAPGVVRSDYDRWHLNSLTSIGNQVVVSCFGRFEHVRGWSEEGALEGAGELIDLSSGDTILDGLTAPHDPVRLEKSWLLCESRPGLLSEYDHSGNRIRSVDLGGWTRGLEVADGFAFVGISAHRYGPNATGARIAIVDLTTFQCLDQIPLETREIFALAFVDTELSGGVELEHLMTAVDRGQETDGKYHEAPFLEEDCNAELKIVSTELSRSSLYLTIEITNRTRRRFNPFGERPITVGLRRHGDGDPHQLDAGRAELREVVFPGESTLARLLVRRESLKTNDFIISLVEEGRAWFCDINPEHGLDFNLERLER